MWMEFLSENNKLLHDIHTNRERSEDQMRVNKKVTSTNRNYFDLFKEGKNMIYTGEFKMFGQLEEQADAGDIDAFVFRNGEVVPASQAENSTGPVIHTAPEKKLWSDGRSGQWKFKCGRVCVSYRRGSASQSG
ncbi:MAG: hypothetical protein ACLRVD_01650 [Blautia caecimuris]